MRIFKQGEKSSILSGRYFLRKEKGLRFVVCIFLNYLQISFPITRCARLKARFRPTLRPNRLKRTKGKYRGIQVYFGSQLCPKNCQCSVRGQRDRFDSVLVGRISRVSVQDLSARCLDVYKRFSSLNLIHIFSILHCHSLIYISWFLFNSYSIFFLFRLHYPNNNSTNDSFH